MHQNNEQAKEHGATTRLANAPERDHGCIVMASGKATRFGGNKLMAKLNGTPLIQYALQATDALFAKRVVVTRSAETAELCRAQGVETIHHHEPYRNDAIRLGMDTLGPCRSITFVQADQPLISTHSIAKLLRAFEEDPACIWRCSFDGQPGAPVLFPRWAFAELRQLPPRKGGGFVAAEHPEQVGTIEVASKWELFDVDTVEDLQALQHHLHQHRCE